MSPRKKASKSEPKISSKAARACLVVARADLARVKDKGFNILPPKYATPRVLEWWEGEQDRRIAACKARIEKYCELSK